MSLAASASFDFSSSCTMPSSVGFSASMAAMRERKNSISSAPRLRACESSSICANTSLRSEYMRMYSAISPESPAKVSSISSWLLREKSFWGSPGPWKSIQYPPSRERNESGAGDEFTNARDGFETPTVREMSSAPSSHGGSPAESSRASISEESSKRKTASARQKSAWGPTASLPVLAPASIESAPSRTLFPAPVSPVTAVKPARKSISALSSSARFSIFKNSIIPPTFLAYPEKFSKPDFFAPKHFGGETPAFAVAFFRKSVEY